MAILAFAGLFAYGAQAAATQADQARQLVSLGSAAGRLTAQLQHERADAGLVFTRGGAPAVEQYRQQAVRTDTDRLQFLAMLSHLDMPLGWQPLMRRIEAQLAELPLLREQVRDGRDASASVAVFRYRALIADLGSYRSGLSQLGVDADTATGLRAASVLSDGIESLGLLQVNVLPVLGADTLSAAAQQQIVAANAQFSEALEQFRQLAPPGWQAQLAAQASSNTVVTGERLQALAAASLPGARVAVGGSARSWVAAIGARMDQLHALESALDDDLVAAVTQQRDDQRRQLLLVTVVVLVCLLVLAAAGWWITRSMTRSLRALAGGATAMAAETLPDIVDRLAYGHLDPGAADALVAQAGRVITVTGSDEIGAVAVAFNQVAATAAELAGKQAQTQAVTTSVTEAIARQVQQVTYKVTAAIDVLERDEQDPVRLQNLYDLDQKATGLYRLIGTLFVFTGQRAGQPTKAPVPMTDVVKAAISRVEGAYNRVDDTKIDRTVLIDSLYAEELVHLLTELLDNAIRFSGDDAQAQVVAQNVGDRIHVQVIDSGSGIPAGLLEELRGRLETFRLDPTTARHKGLPVVGRIARNIGVQVTLRSDAHRPGTRVDVVIPAGLFTVDPDRDFPVFDEHDAPGQPAAEVWPQELAPALPARTVLDAPTQALPQLVAGPPPWPLPAGAVATAPPRLAIFENVTDWFTTGSAEGQPASPALPQDWMAAASAAERGIEPPEQTKNGLPMRRPGQYTIPQLTEAAPSVPAQRDPRRATQAIAALAASARASRHH